MTGATDVVAFTPIRCEGCDTTIPRGSRVWLQPKDVRMLCAACFEKSVAGEG